MLQKMQFEETLGFRCCLFFFSFSFFFFFFVNLVFRLMLLLNYLYSPCLNADQGTIFASMLSWTALKIENILCNLLNVVDVLIMFHEIPTQTNLWKKSPYFFVISGGLGALLMHKIVRVLLRLLQRCKISGLKCLNRSKDNKL